MQKDMAEERLPQHIMRLPALFPLADLEEIQPGMSMAELWIRGVCLSPSGRFSVYERVPREARCFFRTTLSCFARCSQQPECEGSKQREGCGCVREGCGCVRKAGCSQPGEALANWPCAYFMFLHCHPLTSRWIKKLPFHGQLKFEQGVFIK